MSIMEIAFSQELGVTTCNFGGQSEILTGLTQMTGGGTFTSFAGQANAFAEAKLRDNFGKPMVLASYSNAPDVTKSHAFAFIGFDNDDDIVILYDPLFAQTKEVPLSKIVENFQGIFVGQ